MLERTVAAAGVARTYAPPVMYFFDDEQYQMPEATRFTVSFPLKTDVYCGGGGVRG